MKAIGTVLVAVTRAMVTDRIECPILECTDNMEPGVCYAHDGFPHVQKLRGRACAKGTTANLTNKPMYCPFDYNSGNFMWLEEEYQAQRLDADGVEPALS